MLQSSSPQEPNSHTPPDSHSVTLQHVLHVNAQRLERYMAHPLFSLVAHLDDRRQREALLACVQRFSRSFQSLMFVRQAFCDDPKYYGPFLQHLQEEFGHDQLIAQRANATESTDPLLDALLTWFSYQMLTLDNVEKAALVHLVLEASGDRFHNAVAPHLGQFVSTGYFQVHAELDAGHSQMGIALLSEQHPRTYRRILQVVERGWEMLEAISTRMVEVVQKSAEPST